MKDTINVGLASFGMSGRVFHAPLLSQHPQFSLVNILQRHGDDALQLYPYVRISTTFEQLLNDRGIDLIVVNTPDRFHFEMARQALEAGKHVVVEKPFTQTPDEGRELIRIAEEKKLLLTVFQNRRWDSDFLTVKKVIAEGLVGPIVEFESHFDRYRPVVKKDSWKERSDTGAGVVFNLGSHMIDQALVLFGMPEAVTAHTAIVRPGGEIEDWYDIRLHYADRRVSLRSSYLVRELGPRYILHGTLGSFLKPGMDPQEAALTKGGLPGGKDWGREPDGQMGLLHTEKDGEVFRGYVETARGNYMAFYDSVYEAIGGGSPPAVTAREGLDVVRVIDAVHRSVRERRTIELTD
ncbi:MAG TPA: Gfo/Idh/MocA family oxidoreductase [Bacteroidota bacterium]|nr:Gfo/Idh/MocA family oxidoreductase [Bacteroidota bacterium]